MKYYEILGVSEDASQDEIKEAYREKVKETHPDQSDDPNAAQLFMQVQEAYDVLSDPEKREQFDSGAFSDGYQSDSGATGQRRQRQQSYSTEQAENEGVGWRAHTRDSEAAEQIWAESTTKNNQPSHPNDLTQSWGVAKVSTLGMASTSFFIGIFFTMLLLSMTPMYHLEPLPLVNTRWVSSILLVIFLLLMIGIGERLIGTKRRLSDPPDW